MPVIVIQGRLDRITFSNKENGFTIARLTPEGHQTAVTVVGTLAGVRPGELMRLEGDWETHQKFGEQFRVDRFSVILPDTAKGIRLYLSSGILPGVGASMAEKLVEQFGSETLNVIEKDPGRLLEIPGIGAAKADKIAAAWQKHHAVRTLMGILADAGAPTSAGARILNAYGTLSLTMVQEEPYRICREIVEIPFEVADALARTTGMPLDAPERIRAGILHLLERAAQSGHTYMPEQEVVHRGMRLLGIGRETAAENIEALLEERAVVAEEEEQGRCIYLDSLYEAENGIAKRVQAMLSIPLSPKGSADTLEEAVLQKLAIRLSDEQLDVLAQVVKDRVAIITGGPGTGKTTLIRSVCAVMGNLGNRVLLAAPTGRAARRLSEVTGRKAATIHRLLKYNQAEGRFEVNHDTPLDTDLLIIDEASMVDTFLMYHLLCAVPLTSQLLLVGDVSQLPSVGPGNVLADLIVSEVVPSFTLQTIFRQALKSPIVTNAHRVNRGEMPDFSALADAELSEFYFIRQSTPENAVRTIVELCARRIPERFSLDAFRDIQVLTPMHKGEVGTLHLNQVLQEALNPREKNGPTGGMFRPGDKVMHLKNNYKKEVFNGDIGTVCEIRPSEEVLVVDFTETGEDRQVPYAFDELDELTLAYAISVHKSQGSEYPAVVIPLMPQHAPLLQRNLLYTAMTRGKRLVILVGMAKALSMAIHNDRPTRRLSGLSSRLLSP